MFKIRELLCHKQRAGIPRIAGKRIKPDRGDRLHWESHLWEAQSAARAKDYQLLNLCVWVKHNGGMGSLYRSRHELVLVLKHGTTQHQNHIQLGRFGRNRTNVWEYRGANDFGRGDGEGDLLALHPTPKPVAMIQDAILDCTGRGEIVLDPFLGSGTVIIAAERAGRRCFGIELEPKYIDVTIRRWQKLTGLQAHHAESGVPFEELAKEKPAANE